VRCLRHISCPSLKREGKFCKHKNESITFAKRIGDQNFVKVKSLELSYKTRDNHIWFCKYKQLINKNKNYNPDSNYYAKVAELDLGIVIKRVFVLFKYLTYLPQHITLFCDPDPHHGSLKMGVFSRNSIPSLYESTDIMCAVNDALGVRRLRHVTIFCDNGVRWEIEAPETFPNDSYMSYYHNGERERIRAITFTRDRILVCLDHNKHASYNVKDKVITLKN
jgi:hypothetical protein